MSSSMQSLRQSLENIRKEAEDAVAHAKSSATDAASASRAKLDELTRQEAQLMPELNCECPFTCLDNMRETVLRECKEFANATDNNRLLTNFCSLERACTRYIACSRQVLVPKLKSLISEGRLDRSHLITVELMQEMYDHSDRRFAILGKHYKEPGMLTSAPFKEAIQAISTQVNAFKSRCDGLSRDYAALIPADEQAHMVAQMKEVYCDVPRDCLVKPGSMTGKVSGVFQRVGDIFSGVSGARAAPQP